MFLYLCTIGFSLSKYDTYHLYFSCSYIEIYGGKKIHLNLFLNFENIIFSCIPIITNNLTSDFAYTYLRKCNAVFLSH